MRIVIIGGSFGGLGCAQTLAKQLSPKDDVDVLLIEKSNHFYHVVGAPRALVEEDYVPKLFIPYDYALPPSCSFVSIVQGQVTDISTANMVVSYEQDGETLTTDFDYLVLATGSAYPVPIKQDFQDPSREHMEQVMREARDEIANASSVLVVGGGAVGCEIAGEIVSKYSDKSVTLLDSKEELLAGNKLQPKFRRLLNEKMEQKGIRLVLGERMTERLQGHHFGKKTIKTDKGTEIETEVQLLCGGFKPMSELMKNVDEDVVDERGSVIVNDAMQVEKYPFIFAVGDVSSHRAPKTGYWAGQQGIHLAKQLTYLARSKGEHKLDDYPHDQTEIILLPLGPCHGVSQLPVLGGTVMGDKTTWLMKGRDMFAWKQWHDLGACVP